MNICTSPNTPNIGYSRFTKFEKPIGTTRMEVRHIIIVPTLYRLFGKLFRNPYPEDIAVVNIAIRITIP